MRKKGGELAHSEGELVETHIFSRGTHPPLLSVHTILSTFSFCSLQTCTRRRNCPHRNICYHGNTYRCYHGNTYKYYHGNKKISWTLHGENACTQIRPHPLMCTHLLPLLSTVTMPARDSVCTIATRYSIDTLWGQSSLPSH